MSGPLDSPADCSAPGHGDIAAAALTRGRRLAAQGSFGEAAAWFSQGLLADPRLGYAQQLAWQAQQLAALEGEQQRRGLGENSYLHWLAHAEPPLGNPLEPLQQEWWLLLPSPAPNEARESSWVALQAAVGPQAVPAGVIPPGQWPLHGWLVLLAPGVRLRRGALQCVELWLAQQLPEAQPHLLYGDEDVLSAAGERSNPWFKPDWVAESFWSTPWLESFSCWNLAWLRHQGALLPPEDSEGRFGWMLALLEREPRIGHIPRILVHAPLPAPEAAAETRSSWTRALLLREHLHRLEEPVEEVLPHEALSGAFRLHWPQPRGLLCRVIIPTRDRADLLAAVLHTVERAAAAVAGAHEVELVVVDNGSEEPATAELLDEWRRRLDPRFSVLRLEEPFNWSRLNNAAVAGCAADLLLFLNNDVECCLEDPRQNDGWLGRMAAQAVRPRVGCVGALLLYEDGTLQHAGVVVGMHGVADHAYRGLPPEHGVHRGRSRCHSAWGAVTGGCLMVRRELFERLGGFDEGLPVEGNDVDFCLRLGGLGLRHVIDPAVVLTHRESQSRDPHASATAAEAYRRMRGRWSSRLALAGPWWPPACSRDHADGRPMGLEFLL